MSRVIHQAALPRPYNAAGKPVKVGHKVHHAGDRRHAVVGGWDPTSLMVMVWTIAELAGDVRHLVPYRAEALGLEWRKP